MVRDLPKVCLNILQLLGAILVSNPIKLTKNNQDNQDAGITPDATWDRLSNSAKYCSIRSLRRITRLWASSVDVIPEVDGISDSYPPIEIHIGLTNWIRPMSIYVVAHIHDICRCDSPIGIAVTAVVFNHTDAAS